MKKRGYQYLLTLGHFCSDINQGSLGSILPFLIAAYNFDYQTAASLVFVSNLVGSVVQPLFGDLADRKNIPWSMAIGIMLAAGGMALTGFMDNFFWLCVCVSISGVGSSIFHPQAARLINKVSNSGHTGNSVSIFSFGGNMGFTIGPILITFAITTFGLNGTGVLFIPALLASGWIFYQSKNLTDEGLKKLEERDPDLNRLEEEKKLTIESGETLEKKQLPDQWKSFAILSLFVFARSIILTSMNTFLSLYFINELGQTETFGNSMLSIYYATSTITTLFGGVLADRMGYVKTVKIAFAVLAGSLVLFALGRSVALCIIFMLPIAAGMNLSYSPIIVLGQKYLPNHVGLASGLTMGLAMSLGGLMSPVLGRIADNYGLQMTMYILAAFSVVPMIIVLFMPQPVEEA